MTNKITLFDYQREGIDKIFEEFKTHRRVLYQLSTGGGKTIVFSSFTKEWLDKHETNVLILCHKEELVTQTVDSLRRIGIAAEAITSKQLRAKHFARVYVSMVKTGENRLKKNSKFFHNIGVLITDECHILLFEGVKAHYPTAKLLGCTATPVLDKKINYFECAYCGKQDTIPNQCCGKNMQEWIKPLTMSHYYDTIVVGVSISELIKRGRLVQDVTYIEKYANLDGLKMNSKGDDFSEASMDDAYTNTQTCFDVISKYEQYCHGKKTIVFNGTTGQNVFLYNEFVNAGYTNVKMYDSVNSLAAERKSVVEWFENTPDAILLNVGVFTTGFDVTDIEAVIVNRPTASLSLWLQMVGRGGRTTDKIYKPFFIVIDGGQNVERFGEWSNDDRDWVKIFWSGTSEPKLKRSKNDVEDITICPACKGIIVKNIKICPLCGAETTLPVKMVRTFRSTELQAVRDFPPPNGEQIYKYTKSLGKDMNFAHKILINQICDMFRYYRVNEELYLHARGTGEVEKKVKKMIRSPYFVLMSKHDIQAPNNRTINNLIDRTLEKLKEMYGIE